jgi:hypothetical protein
MRPAPRSSATLARAGLDNNATEGATLPVWERIRALDLRRAAVHPGKPEFSFTSITGHTHLRGRSVYEKWFCHTCSIATATMRCLSTRFGS